MTTDTDRILLSYFKVYSLSVLIINISRMLLYNELLLGLLNLVAIKKITHAKNTEFKTAGKSGSSADVLAAC